MKDKIRSKIDSEKKRMKYFRMTLQYSNKYIWYLLLLAVCPSVLTAFVFSPYGTIDYFCNFRAFYGADFRTIYLVASGINPKLYYLGIVGLVVIPVCFSILFGAVERHMRVGEFNLGFDRILTRLNFNFLTALKFSMMLFVVYEIFKFLQVVMFYLLTHSLQIEWAFALSLIWYVALYAAELFLLAATILWVPTMLQTGLKTNFPDDGQFDDSDASDAHTYGCELGSESETRHRAGRDSPYDFNRILRNIYVHDVLRYQRHRQGRPEKNRYLEREQKTQER